MRSKYATSVLCCHLAATLLLPCCSKLIVLNLFQQAADGGVGRRQRRCERDREAARAKRVDPTSEELQLLGERGQEGSRRSVRVQWLGFYGVSMSESFLFAIS